MANIIGSVEQLLPRTFYWNLENKIVQNDSASERFTVYEDKYDYFFYIHEYGNYYWCINLCRPEFHVLEFDILVKAQYKEDSDDISRINFRMYEDKRKLNTVHRKGLLGVTCTFSNIRVIKRRLDESDETKSTDKQENKSEKRQHEDDEITMEENKKIAKSGENEEEESLTLMYTGERNKAGGRQDVISCHFVRKPKGLLALSRHLKDIFLDDEESDVVLNVGDKKYPAHKIIIRARSPVFYAMLKNDTREKIQGFVDIPDCDPHIFKDFLLYLYTGHLDNISHENAKELYYMADKYEVNELRFDCTEFLCSNLNADVFCDVLCLGERHNEFNIVETATVFFVHNSEDILASENWQKFVKENPVKVNEFYIKAYNRFPRPWRTTTGKLITF